MIPVREPSWTWDKCIGEYTTGIDISVGIHQHELCLEGTDVSVCVCVEVNMGVCSHLSRHLVMVDEAPRPVLQEGGVVRRPPGLLVHGLCIHKLDLVEVGEDGHVLRVLLRSDGSRGAEVVRDEVLEGDVLQTEAVSRVVALEADDGLVVGPGVGTGATVVAGKPGDVHLRSDVRLSGWESMSKKDEEGGQRSRRCGMRTVKSILLHLLSSHNSSALFLSVLHSVHSFFACIVLSPFFFFSVPLSPVSLLTVISHLL